MSLMGSATGGQNYGSSVQRLGNICIAHESIHALRILKPCLRKVFGLCFLKGLVTSPLRGNLHLLQITSNKCP